MILFKTQHLREQHGISWHEELILGAAYALGGTWTNDIIDSVRNAMSPNTAHKYVTQLIKRGYLQQTRGEKDKRYANVDVTQKAVDYLADIQEVAWTREQ